MTLKICNLNVKCIHFDFFKSLKYTIILIHFAVQYKLMQHYKVTILQ